MNITPTRVATSLDVLAQLSERRSHDGHLCEAIELVRIELHDLLDEVDPIGDGR